MLDTGCINENGGNGIGAVGLSYDDLAVINHDLASVCDKSGIVLLITGSGNDGEGVILLLAGSVDCERARRDLVGGEE